MTLTSDSPASITASRALSLDLGGGMSLVPGQEITLSGADYGAAPTVIMASDFENLANGAEINGADSQFGYKTAITTQFNKFGDILADSARAHSGTKSAKVTWSISASSAFGVSGMNPGTEELRMIYWRYQNNVYDTDVLSANIKQFYVFGSNSEFPQALLMVPAGQTVWRVYNNVQGPAPSEVSLPHTVNDSQGKWELWDVYLKNNSGVGADDGIFRIRKNGKLVLNNTSYPFQESLAGTFDDIRLGHYAAGALDSEVWYDEVIFSEGEQAIFVSTSSTWNDAEDQDLAAQVPKSWGEAITFDLNASALPVGQPLYCHVFKEDGSIVSQSIGAL